MTKVTTQGPTGKIGFGEQTADSVCADVITNPLFSYPNLQVDCHVSPHQMILVSDTYCHCLV